jgi:hypothetical protein
MPLVLDAGALVAIDRRSRRVDSLLEFAQRSGQAPRTSGAVVAQVWRNGARQANLARTLAGVDIFPLDDVTGHKIGELLARSGTGDVVDGHVAMLTERGDTVLTSDDADIETLLQAKAVQAIIQHV